ncbi:MAG: zinc-dependent peptidase [Salinisphaera sp.]|nr:zinc-dependent peptidase [Salinisphaera sp.]
MAALVGFALWLFLQPLFSRRRRRRLEQRPLPGPWRRQLQAALPRHLRLAPPLQRRLEARVQVFLDGKRFHGCAGFAIDDEVRLTIAAHACLLRLQPEADCYPGVREILVYPSAFWVHHPQPDEFGLVDDAPDLLAGEAWQQGRVILSWEDVTAAVGGGPGNVVVHEFAHQLDFETDTTVGAPALADYGDWATVFSAEFERLRAAGSPVLDAYGAEKPAEFFAVAAEAYVQSGAELARYHPELYRLLREYFVIETAG